MEPAERSRGDPAEIVNHQKTCYFWTEKLKRSEVKVKIKCWEDVYKGINHLHEKHPINFLPSTFWRSGTSKPRKGSPLPNGPEGFLGRTRWGGGENRPGDFGEHSNNPLSSPKKKKNVPLSRYLRFSSVGYLKHLGWSGDSIRTNVD